ncbi:AraC family transcriptional regulator [Flagellimonas aquimarina]|uniref:AraC family transcriptional regulator n=1 Tax=Flagellimonas aquimarina TaxID=2201895 RepID=A0A316L6B5_9FLAO|nr:AraC family transcriptional regulator [Allomuricauda koreensis]PWL40465.1 AraC family transcriptional regulator [Allomuricauda koreensis]
MKDNSTKIAQYHLHKTNPKKLQFEVYDLKEYRAKNIKKAAAPHSHSYYQIIWFFNKGGTHTVDFKTYDINENTILFISKDQIHFFDDNLDIPGWLIHFNESFFMHTDVDIFLKHNIFKAQKSACYAMDFAAIQTAKNYVTLILNELDNRNRFGFEDIVRFLLKSLLINLERAHLKDLDEKLEFTSPYQLQFFRFKELVEENYNNGLSVIDFANLLHISSKTLTTITNTVANKPPSQIISDRIILEAKRLLKFTSLQIGEVAFRVGFDDPSYFIKYFKRHVSISPNKYRFAKG